MMKVQFRKGGEEGKEGNDWILLLRVSVSWGGEMVLFVPRGGNGGRGEGKHVRLLLCPGESINFDKEKPGEEKEDTTQIK